MNTLFVESIISDLHFVAMDPNEQYKILKDQFLNKLIESGVGPENNFESRRYDTKSIILYKVSNDFPRLTKSTISFKEIENVTYTINLSGIERFKEEELW